MVRTRTQKFIEEANQKGSRARSVLDAKVHTNYRGIVIFLSFMFLILAGSEEVTSWLQPYATDHLAYLVLDTPLGRYAIVAGLGLLATGFYKIRKRSRDTYACLEIGVAAAITYLALGRWFKDQNAAGAITTILGAVYVTIRGFDNLGKYDEDQQKKLTQPVDITPSPSHTNTPSVRRPLAKRGKRR